MDWCNGKRGFCQHDAHCSECEHFNGEGLVELSESLLDHIRQLEAKAPRWISVKERLPNIRECVIICSGNGGPAEGCMNGDGTWTQYRWSAKFKKEEVTHWMPLPEPPKEDS